MKYNLDHALSIQVFEQGQSLCQQSYVDCSSYHFMRPILRRIGAVPSPFSHEDFYTSAIENTLDDVHDPNVTISGTADYSWLLRDSPLLKALEKKGKSAQIEVIDGCPTPTSFSMLVSKELDQHSVRVSARNITQFLSEKNSSDLIVTDAFLTQFNQKEDRLAILSQWKQALKLGGFVVTTAQIYQKETVKKNYAKNMFIENTALLYAKSNYQDALRLSTEKFSTEIQAYSSPNASRIYGSEHELVTEIEESGMKIEELTPMSIYSNSSEKVLTYRGIVLKVSS